MAEASRDPQTEHDPGEVEGADITQPDNPLAAGGSVESPTTTVKLDDDRSTQGQDGSATLDIGTVRRSSSEGTREAPSTERSGSNEDVPPDRGYVGRYRVTRLLGRGSYGLVYLAHDDELNRRVAIKVPHHGRAESPEFMAAVVYEARILAGLDHEAIVPIYDVGYLEDGSCYIVSKFIDGTSLERRLQQGRPSPEVIAVWTLRAAGALAYAHTRGVIHRDIKPANLLLDAAGHLFVADFGLALWEADVEGVRGFAGTPSYTSPEQARREGHRVEPRSDLFSLGVVLYQALTGCSPFKAPHVLETLANIANQAPRSPRDIDPAIPEELERICMKAMAKRIDDRYETGLAMADDLQHWRDQSASPRSSLPRTDVAGPIRIAPRGLRAFKESDSEFFLALLPGPRGRNNLPESLGFWKTRIETRDGDETFSLGVLYGPSGSGKSSLVRAGLIPRLSPRVRTIYIEATAEETETRLLRGLRRAFPELSIPSELVDLLRAIRNGEGLEGDEKVLIVIDQFEQWLFGRREDQSRVLEETLRQCDGLRVQAMVLVRDEFWMDLTRFVRALEVPLVDGRNSAAVDLFERDHARKVLSALGHAYDRLPAHPHEFSADQLRFLDQALEGLAEAERFVCARLTLFAELLRAKPWLPSTLQELGGVAAIGVTILDDAFAAHSTAPKHRLLRRPAREVLALLLPRPGVPIKGHMVSRGRLEEVAGTPSFDDLMDILDRQLRLVTPVDPERGVEESSSGEGPPQYYQLSHDYLIPDLREWLLRDRQQTARGRAELRLQEFASVWSTGRQTRFLPTVWEWAVLFLMTNRRRWTTTQSRMMRAATARHVRFGLVLLVLLGTCGWLASWKYRALRAHSLVENLESAEIGEVLRLAQELKPYRHWAVPLLKDAIASTTFDPRQRLHARIALVDDDSSQVDELADRLMEKDTDPITVLVLRDALYPYRDRIRARLWNAAEDPKRVDESRFRAALALAKYDAPTFDAQRWNKVAETAADVLVRTIDRNPSTYTPIVEAVGPIRHVLIPRLRTVFLDANNARRSMATSLLADLAHDDTAMIGELALDADATQFSKLYPIVEQRKSDLLPTFLALARQPIPAVKDGEANRLAHRRALAAIMLIKLDVTSAGWEVFRNEPDPRARTILIHQSNRYGVPVEVLLARLKVEKTPSTIVGLMLAVGEHEGLRVAVAQARQIARSFLDHRDAGVVAAAEWLSRQIEPGAVLTRLNGETVKPRDLRVTNWYVTKEGHRMAIIDVRHIPSIGRIFAIASNETTIEQMSRFIPNYWFDPAGSQDGQVSPASVIPWPLAIDYCQWLNKRDGVPDARACYPIDGANGADHLPSAKLANTGYRLPTLAEREFACRAGTTTRRYYGDGDDLLSRYGWCGDAKKLQPVGSLIPNDFGLFDMYGNVSEWTADIRENGQALIAGGSINIMPGRIDSGYAFPAKTDLVYNSFGFRVARTIELDENGWLK